MKNITLTLLLALPCGLMAQQGTTVNYPFGSGTSGNLACFSAPSTAVNCTAKPPIGVLGVFFNYMGTSYIFPVGEVPVNLDATVNTVYGDILCASTTVAGVAHDNGATMCSGTPYIGIATVTSTMVTSVDAEVIISGSAGATGPTGATGSAGATGAAGAAGATGATGSAGTNGATGSAGPTGPVGGAGSAGAAGANGNTVLSGTAVPSSGTGSNGDFYVRNPSTTPCMYGPKAAGAWPGSCITLVGPIGTTGAMGSTGATGSNGATGSTGPTGATGPAGINTFNGQTLFSGTAPTVSACGTSPSLATGATNNSGTINVGTGVSITACTLSFSVSFTNPPSCQFSASTSGLGVGLTAVSASAVTAGVTLSLGGGKMYYQCF